MPPLENSGDRNRAIFLVPGPSPFCLFGGIEAERQTDPSVAAADHGGDTLAVHDIDPGARQRRPAGRQTGFSDQCAQWRSCFEEEGVAGKPASTVSHDR
jgi:hypothetical protein